MPMWYTRIESPLGRLLLVADERGITQLSFLNREQSPRPEPDWREDAGPFAAATSQLEAYFAGERRAFDLALAPRGTPFQLRVWEALREIPHGTTTSYGALADRIGQSGAARAVGAANGANPVAIVIPCHRVIGASGKLVGYGGGLDLKEKLLAHEQGALFALS